MREEQKVKHLVQFWQEWLLIALLLLIMLLKGILWSLALPLWQGPDEEDHYNVIQFIGELGRLPDREDTYLIDEVALSRQLADVGRLPYAPEQRQVFSTGPSGPGEESFSTIPPAMRSSFELQAVGKLNKATPLYYMIAAVPYRLFQSGDLLTRMQVQRIFALIMSCGIVVVAYLTAKLLFPTDAMMRLTIPTLVAFQPMISQMTAVVSVDGFYFLCYSLLILISIMAIRDRFDWRYGLALGIIFSIGFLTKPTLSGFAPLIAIMVLYDFWRGKGRRMQIFWGAVVMAVMILMLTSWWLVRSLRINNDLFYFNPVLEGHRIIQNPFYDYQPLVHMLDYYRSVWGGIFVTWWAHFGWLDTALPPWIYTLLRFLTFLAITGLVYWLVRNWRRRPTFADWIAGSRNAPLVVWTFLALTLLVPIVLLQFYDLTFWWQYGNGRGLQGRYWLGTIVPMLTFFTLGLLVWVPRRWRGLGHHLLRIGMVLLSFLSLLAYVLPRFYL
ncbi:MAG: glycosyltransferase family 39 protein [Candidatus Promineifilaceae bacterium]|nr:glycosyltransferase family 39 protein [Candidatus Promineifilaceae bacterium]